MPLKIRYLLLTAWLCLAVQIARSQSLQIAGRVTANDTRQALPGVNVSIDGTTTGTTTDADGQYRLTLPSVSSTVVFSYIGYITQRINAGGRTQLEVMLIEDNKSLNEVVVVGLYGFVVPESGVIGGNGQISNTNWVNELVQTGGMDNYELAIRGGESKLKFYLSGALLKQKGVLVFTDYKRYTGKLNLDYQASEKLKIGTSINFTRSVTNGTPENEFGVFQAALFKAPVNPVFATDGTYFTEDISNVFNPIAVFDLETRLNVRNRLLTNAFAEYSILPGLTFKTSWGADLISAKNEFFQPSTSRRLSFANGSASYFDETNWIYEHTLTYANTFGLHRINALLGYSQLENTGSSNSAAARDYGTNSIETLNVASTPTTATSSKTANGLSSLFGRVGYIYAGKYYLEASLRQDGSSKFGANNRYALFPAASAGGQAGREAFFKGLSSVGSDLKFRASYGRTGNQGGIGNYTAQSCGQFGEISATAAAAAGCAGAVIDGSTRDSNYLIDMGFPTFCRFRNPVEAFGQFMVVDYQLPIYVKGMSGLLQVNPGDYIFGDNDGVVVVPQELTIKVLEIAEHAFADEAQSRQAMATGRDPFEVYQEFGRF